MAATIQGGISTLDLMEGKVSWLKVIRFDKPLDVAQALSKGEVDVAVITAEMYAKFALRGGNLKIIAVDMLQNQAIIGNVDGVEGLRGKRIGATTASGTFAMFKAYMKLLGINDYQVVDLPPPQIPIALKRGDVDAVVAWEPLVSKLLASGQKEVASFMELWSKFSKEKPVMLVWVATDEFARSNMVSELVKMRDEYAKRWGELAPSVLKEMYGLNDQEVKTLMDRVVIWTGTLEEAKGGVLQVWKLARDGGYLRASDQDLERLAERAFWRG